MISRVNTKPRKSITWKEDDEVRSGSITEEYGDCLVGFMDDVSLISCGGSGAQMSLREMLRGSVGMTGGSRLGITEKVVLLEGKLCAVKRFRSVSIGRSEFRRRVEKLAQICNNSDFLVPLTAFLYAKRIKFVVCDYFPMGSLADLLAGERESGHTALNWNQRLMIILTVAQAIAFIHTQCPANYGNMQTNVHGGIKPSNIIINVDFTARLSDYGFTQLAELVEVLDTWQGKPQTLSKTIYSENLGQKSDIYNFGMVLLDMLGGAKAGGIRMCIVEKKEYIKEGSLEFFEVAFMESKHRKQALQVLDIALACTNRLSEARPSIEQVLLFIGDVIIKQ